MQKLETEFSRLQGMLQVSCSYISSLRFVFFFCLSKHLRSWGQGGKLEVCVLLKGHLQFEICSLKENKMEFWGVIYALCSGSD